MNINENKEIDRSEPQYVLRGTYTQEYTQKFVEVIHEFEYDEDISIFQSTLTTEEWGEKKEKVSFWLGYIGATRMYYLAYPKTLDEAFEVIDNDYAWFRSQLKDVYQIAILEKK